MEKHMLEKKIEVLEHALAVSAGAYYSINLTKNLVPGTMYQVLDGERYSINAQIGMGDDARFTDVVSYWSHAVSEEEKPRYFGTLDIENLLARHRAGENQVFVRYWTKNALGGPMLAEQHVLMYDDEESGDVLAITYVLDLTEKDQQEKRALKLHTEKQILGTICQDFASVFYMDFSQKRLVALKSLNGINLFGAEGRESADFDFYEDRLRECFEGFVDQESSPEFVEVLGTGYLRGKLRNQKRVTYRFDTVLQNGKIYHLEAAAIRVDGDCDGAILSFRSVNDIISQEEKKKEELRQLNLRQAQQLNTIGGLTNAYFAAYWVDLGTGACRAVKNIPFFQQVVGDCASASDVTNAFLSLCVQPEDQQKMAAFTDQKELTQRLSQTDVVVQEFHGTVMPWEWCRASWIVAGRDEAGQVLSVLFTVEDITALVADRMQRARERKRLEEQHRVISGLSREYATVWLVKDNGMSSVLYQDTKSQDIVRESVFFSENMQTYSECMRDYCENYVSEEDKEEFDRKTRLDTVLREIRNQAVYSVVYSRCYNGQTGYYQVCFAQTGEGEDSNDFVMGFKNVNDVVLAEHQRNEALAEALVAAEHANRAKTQFLNSMSHDIRTPMNAIIGFTSLAASHINNQEKVKEYLRKIGTSSEHLLSLINDVLDMSRIESGKVKIDERPLHMPDLLHDIRTIIQPTISSKQLDFLIDTVDVVDEDIITDKLRLTQVLLNILGNGVKFNKTGGLISLRVKQEKKAPKGCATYHFIIRDTGIGISQEFQEHIFESFSRAETATVSGIQGTGLGLSITKKIVDMMGGTIRLKSEEGVGSEFDVCLTFRLSGEKKVYEKIESLQGLRVLVADDDTDTCLSIATMLSEIGMRSEWTVSGKEAVVRAKHAVDMGDEFYAYIIDWLMPDMNGIETVRRIRKVIGDGSPIIILTAYDWSDVEEEAREAGVTAFCEKPLFMSELRDILSQPVEVKSKAPKPEEKPTQGKRILLVEDNELNQEIAVEVLKEAGFLIEVVADGSAAVERMTHSTPEQYDLILMDIQMPIMDGYEATKRIRAMEAPHCKTLPIIAMTANAFDEDREKAAEAGMSGYLAKPIQIDKMLKTISQML